MASVNLVILMGHLGKDPELKYSQQGAAFCDFSIATSETIGKEADGKPKVATEWHNIVCFGQVAENAKKHLFKGSGVHLEGKKQTQSWDDRQGVKQYKTVIVAHKLKYLPAAAKREEHDAGNYQEYWEPQR